MAEIKSAVRLTGVKTQDKIRGAMDLFINHQPGEARLACAYCGTLEQCVLTVAIFRKSMPKDWVVTDSGEYAVVFTIPEKEGLFVFTADLYNGCVKK